MATFKVSRRALAAVLALYAFGFAGMAGADQFNTLPTRQIGPTNNVTVGASINAQGGWTVTQTQFDEEISTAHAHAGRQAWHVSNWYHQGTVNAVLTPAFPPVKEGAPGSRNHIDIEYWFYVPSGNAGLVVSSSLSDAPGQRLTYAAVKDDGTALTVQVVGIQQGSGWTNTDPPPFDDAGVHYDIRSSGTLAHDTWYRLHETVDLNNGAQNDQVTYTVYNADGTTAWASGAMPSWEDAYLAGTFSPPGIIVTADHVGFRIVENPDHLNNRLPYGYASNRPAGLYLDDISATPNISAGFAIGFENDRYVSTNGTDAGDCSIATPDTARCKTIAYALTQAGADNTIHIASGVYDLGSGPALTLNLNGLQLLGEGPTQPQIKRTVGAADQALMVVNNVTNVRVRNLEFDMDQSYVAEGVIASGVVTGLSIDNNHFVSSRSNTGQNSQYKWRNAVAINYNNNSLGLPRVDGSSVSITNNIVDGIVDPNVFLRAGIQMDAGNGSISGNTITAGVHDIVVRFATANGSSSGTSVGIDGNHTFGRGIEFDAPNASVTGISISNNDIHALVGIDGFANNYGADWSILRLMDNATPLPVSVSGNTFAGYQGSYRGVLVQNFPNATFTGNTFTPANGVSDFVSLVISNKELNTDNPPDAPLPMSITANGNTFNGSGVANAGRAVEFLNDNDAAGTAQFGSLDFGTTTANTFDGNLRWYFHLDDYNCETTSGSPLCVSPPLPNYNGAIGGSAALNTDVRPFSGNVSAANNTFAGKLPSAMSTTEQADLEGRTYDASANAALGTVNYGFGEFQTVYVDATFTGIFGDPVGFTSPAADCGAGAPQTGFLGVNAFTNITQAANHVQAGGFVCIAAGSLAENVVVAKSVHIVGAGQGATIVMPATYNPDCSGAAPGTADSMCTGGGGPASVVFLVRASDVNIYGLTVDGINLALNANIAARNGIMTDITGGPYANFSVHDTTVKNIYLRGIYAPDSPGGQGVSNFNFSNNTVQNVKSDPASIGIFSRYGTGIVDHNSVDGANDAISANWSKGVTFSYNSVTNSASGIHTDNNGGGGGTADLIENNSVDCNVVDAYGAWVFANYADTIVRNNTVSRCAIGIGSFGGRTSGSPPKTVSFIGNKVDGTGATTSASDTVGAYLSTTTFYYGDYPNNVALTGNTLSGFGQGVFTERTGSPAVALATTASFNRIVGNTTGWVDGAGPGTSTFINNWWGCNGGPGASGCDTASNAAAVNPWLVLQASAAPNPTSTGTSTIAANLTHNSANALVGTAFPDGTSLAFTATRGAIAAAAMTTGGNASTNLTGLSSGWSTVHVKLDNADVQLIVAATPAAAFATVNDDTTGTNPDPDATCPTPDFNNITDAVNALAAGGKILVCSGNYPENVVVNKSLTLKGAFAGTAGNAGARGTNEAVILPPTGVSLTFGAANATVDGMTIAGSSGGGHAITLSGANPNNLTLTNDRIVDVTNGSGFSAEPGSTCVANNLTFNHNLFSNIGGSGAANGRGIRLGNGICTVLIDDNTFDTMLYAINANGGNGGPLQDMTITGNTANNTTGTAFVITNTTHTSVTGNTIASTTGGGGLFISDSMDDFTASCNSISTTGNGISTLDFFGNVANTGVRIFDNAINAATDVSNSLTQNLVLGSNWYGGSAATIGGSNPNGALVADPLPASPIGQAACGNNTPTQIVAYAGSPQTTPINTAFANPLVARVQDALGGAVMASQTITFTPPASGASAALGTASGSTNYNGVFSTTATANGLAGSYMVSAASGALSTSPGFALTNAKGTGTVVWDVISFVYSGSNVTPTAHIAEESGATCVFTPTSVGPNVGTYPVSANCDSANYTATGNTMVSITPATATLSLSHLTQAYDGAPKSVLVTTSPAGVGYAVTYVGTGSTSYGPSAYPPVAVGTYTATASVNDPNYVGSNVSGTLTIVTSNGDISLVVNGPVDPIHVGDYAQFAATMLANPALHTGETFAYEVVLSKSGGSPLAISDVASMEVFYNGSWVDVTTFTGGSLPFTPDGNGNLVYTFPDGIPGYMNGFPILDPSWTWNVRFTFATQGTYTGSWTLEDGTTHAVINPLVTGSAAVVVQPALPPTDIHLALGGPVENQQTNTPVEYTGTMTADPSLHTGETYYVKVTIAKSGGTHTLTAADLSAFDIYYQGSWQPLPPGSFVPDGNGNLVYYFPQPQSGFAIQDPEWTWNFRVTYADTGTYTATAQVIHDSDANNPSPQVFASDAISTTVVPQVIVPPAINLVLNGPLTDVAVGAPAEYTGTLVANPADFTGRTFWVRVRLSKNGGANAMTTADLSKLELYQGGTWVDATAPIEGVMVADGNDLVYYFPQPNAAFAIASTQWTWNFRFTYADVGTFAADADIIDSTDLPLLAAASLANATISTNVVAMAPDVALDLQGPVSGTQTGVPTAFTARLQNTGGAVPENSLVNFRIARSGGTATTSDLALEYFDGSVYQPLPLATCGDDTTKLCGSFGPPVTGFPIGAAYDATTALRATFATADTWTVQASVVGVPSATVYASDTLITQVTVTSAQVTLNAASLHVVYDGNPHAATATTTPSGLTVAFTYDGSSTAPTNAGSYNVVATITQAGYAGSTSGTLVIDPAPITVTLSNLTQTYDGSAKSAIVSTSPSVVPVSVTYDGSIVAPSAVGSYAVFAVVTDPNYTGSASGTLTINPVSVTVTLSNLAQTYDGTQKAATVATNPNGITTSVTYDGVANAPIAAGSYNVVATVTQAGYSGSVSGTLVIAKATATVTLSNLTQPFNGLPRPVTATTVPSVATSVTYDGSMVAPSAVGTYSVFAVVTDPNYNGSASGTLTIESNAVVVTLSNLAQTYDGTAKSATVSTSPNATTSVTYDGSPTAPTNAGSYNVVATVTQAGYSGSASGTLVIAKAAATVTLSNLTQTFDGTAKSATVMTVPASLATSVTYDGGAAPSAIGSYTVVATVTDPNYTGAASGTLNIVAASAPDLSISITDDRNFVQYGKLLTYRIAVNNIGNVDVSGASVSVALPNTVLGANPGWICVPLGTATCGSGGNGALSDTANIPANGGVVYLLNVWAKDDTSLSTDEIQMQANVTASGDIDTGNNTASDLTTMVIFRDGFEVGGDGAESAATVDDIVTIGGVDANTTQFLDLSSAWASDGRIVKIAGVVAGPSDSLAVQAVRIDGQLLVRLVGIADGKPLVGEWSAVPSGTNMLALGLGTANGHSLLILTGASEDLTAALSNGAVSMTVFGAKP